MFFLSYTYNYIYIYMYFFFFFTAYGWPIRLEMQNPFFGPKSAHGTKGLNKEMKMKF